MKGISTPTPLSEIKKFEAQNPTIAVNVLGYDEDEENEMNEEYQPMGENGSSLVINRSEIL